MLQEYKACWWIFCRVSDGCVKELKAFVWTFGSYGVDRLDRMLKEHTAALLNCIDTSLRVNLEILEAVAGSMHSGDRIDTEANIKQIVDMGTMVKFCIQTGLAITFDSLIAEASGVVIEEGEPLIYSLLAGSAKHLPSEIPENKEIRRMRRVANTVNIVGDHDSKWIISILEDVGGGGASDGSWSLLLYLFAACMTNTIWDTTTFNVGTGGFSNNVHCLARCICAVIVDSEFVRLEREYEQNQSLSNGHSGKMLNPAALNYLSKKQT